MPVYLHKELPSAYQEVEYIESSGTQYIILGNSFKTSYKAVIDFQMTVIGGDYIPLGIKYSTTRYGIDAYNSKFMVNGGGEIWNNTISEDTNRHTITIDKGTARVDGNNYSVSYTNYTFSQGIGVFCYNEYDKSPQYNYKSSNKLYKLDIYDENGSHIYDIVPCYRKSDNIIGLYDLVNDQFYTNQGSGTFTKGSNVSNSHTVECLSRCYLGDQLLVGGECGWKPGTNTVLYCPFSTDMVNKIDNTAPVSQSGASISNGYLTVSNGYLTYTTSKYVGGSQPWTFNTWLYMYSINTWNRRVIRSTNQHFMELRITGTQRQSYQGIPQRTIMSQGDTDSRWVNNGFRIPLNEWHNICVIFDGTKIIQYYDTQKLEIGISIDWDTSSQTNSLGIGIDNNYDRFDGRQSELIIENGNWSENMIINYYNQTKANY